MERCDATVLFGGFQMKCDGRAGHKGRHFYGSTCCGKTCDFMWEGEVDASWPEPEPTPELTPFEKAWQNGCAGSCGYNAWDYKDIYKAAWTARGAAIYNQIMDDFLKSGTRITHCDYVRELLDKSAL